MPIDVELKRRAACHRIATQPRALRATGEDLETQGAEATCSGWPDHAMPRLWGSARSRRNAAGCRAWSTRHYRGMLAHEISNFRTPSLKLPITEARPHVLVCVGLASPLSARDFCQRSNTDTYLLCPCPITGSNTPVIVSVPCFFR